MRPTARSFFLVGLISICAAPAQAQDGTVRGPDGAVIGVASGQSGGAGRQTPRGPISLTLERKSVQTLADGTHITRVTHETFLRDSSGRTRIENEFGPMPGPGFVTRNVNVNDVVTGTTYNWQVGQPNGRKVYTTRQRIVNGQPPLMRTLPAQPGGFGTTHSTAEPGGPAVRIVPPPPPPPTGTSSVTTPAMPQGLRPEITRDPLGQRIIGGLVCTAQRVMTVYPIGYFGNDAPIVSMDEMCISQEAGHIIEEIREDPRTGVETVTLLSGSQEEPDRSLFLPPPDYTEQKPVVMVQPQR